MTGNTGFITGSKGVNANDIDNSTVDYLIITANSLVSSVEPLAAWKLAKGLTTDIITVETIEGLYSGSDVQEAIQNCIHDYHEHNSTTWVLLAGNDDFVPVCQVSIDGSPVVCDQYYSKPGNWIDLGDGMVEIIDYHDWDCDVYLGRLPAENEQQMDLLIQRILDYETNPPVGSWMTRAVCAGAFANFNYDINNNSIFDEEDYPEFDANRYFNWIRTAIIPSEWNATCLGEAEGLKTTDYPYDLPLSEDNLVEALKNGVGVGMFDAHGSTTGMYRMIFAKDWDNDSLFDYKVDTSSSVPLINVESDIGSEGKDGFFILNACSTGNFDFSGIGLAEHILLNCGIGVIASSRSAMYEIWEERDHEGWYSQGQSARFWSQLFTQGVNQPGKAFVEAKKDYVDDFQSLQEIDDTGDRTMVQYNLLGDPEVHLWTAIPDQLEGIYSYSSNSIQVEVTCSNQAITGATVTLAGTGYYQRGSTDELGMINFPLPDQENLLLNLTVTKNNYLPYEESLEDVPLMSTSSETTGLKESTASFLPFLPVILVLIIAVRKRK